MLDVADEFENILGIDVGWDKLKIKVYIVRLVISHRLLRMKHVFHV